MQATGGDTQDHDHEVFEGALNKNRRRRPKCQLSKAKKNGE